jgi:hypothetical protein
MKEHGTLPATVVEALASGTAADPAVQHVARLIAGALVRLTVEVRAAAGQATTLAWLTAEDAVLAVPDGQPGDGEDEPGSRILSLPVTHVVAALCHLLEVGPRPRLAGQRAVAASEDVDRLVAGEGAGGSLPERLAGQVRQQWTVGSTWTSASGMEGQGRLAVLDTGLGYFLLDELGDGRVALEPTTPTEVFVALRRVLPTDADMQA